MTYALSKYTLHIQRQLAEFHSLCYQLKTFTLVCNSHIFQFISKLQEILKTVRTTPTYYHASQACYTEFYLLFTTYTINSFPTSHCITRHIAFTCLAFSA